MHRICIFLLLLSLMLSGCTAEQEPESSAPVIETVSEDAVIGTAAAETEKFTSMVFAMDTVMELTVYDTDNTVLTEAAERITSLENKLSVTLPGSEIHTLNTTGSASLSEDTASLLTTALELCERTGGALDISIYPAVRAWGFTTGEYRIPSDDELSEILAHVDYRSVTLDGRNVSIPEGMQVDLGSVAKGYTGDILCDLFRENGISSALLNLGGNVQAVGTKPDGSPWRIAVQHPTDTENYLGALSLSDKAAITSGGYERCFTGDDGETYWHIIDPSTGKPADSGVLSVTIVGESGVLCDAMSTALFVMGAEDAAEYWRSHEGFDFILVTDDGNVQITEGLRDLFTLSDAYADRELTVIER